MTTPSGPISLGHAQTEFGGSNPISLSEYYRGGSLVDVGTVAGTSGAQIATSGAIRLGDFRAVTSVIVGSNITTVGDVRVSPTDSTAQITFLRDGTITKTGNDVVAGANWRTPNGATVGDAYWIRMVLNSGTTPSTGTMSTWQQMNTTRIWTQTVTSTGIRTCNLTVSFATDSGGSNIVATDTFTLYANVDL